MVRSQQNFAVCHAVLGSMPKRIGSLAGQQSTSLEVIEVGLETDPAQGHDYLDILQALNLTIEVRGAGDDLLRRGFVVRRRTSHGSCDVRVLELESVAAMRPVWLVREPGPVQDRVHKVSGCITREGPPSTVRAVRSRR